MEGDTVVDKLHSYSTIYAPLSSQSALQCYGMYTVDMISWTFYVLWIKGNCTVILVWHVKE